MTRRCRCVTQSVASHLGFLFLLLHVTVVHAYGSCCVGAADVCEATYDDNFFITFHCVGANWVGPLQI
ncbi:hypothetical protein OFN94_36145, partial [Escherichia coli]|nr:hypothetical protein [Escherichia coli]